MREESGLRQVAEGVYAWIGAAGDSNAGAIETPDGILAIDAQQNERLARRFSSALRKQIAKPLRILIDTHYHADHIAGNALVSGEAPILAHDKDARQIEGAAGSCPVWILDRHRRCDQGRAFLR
jgi:glyoxylase-like metal-dependent hydrolase (beta-lactamase superfamily II)